MVKKLTIEYVKDQIEKLHPGAICNFTEYKNNNTKLDLICENGHNFKIRYGDIYQKVWCMDCSGKKKHTIEYVKQYIEEKHPGTICNFTEYKNANTKLDLICENGHKYKAMFTDIQQGYWCAECVGLKKLTVEYVKQLIKEKHPGAICNFDKYKNSQAKLDLICENGHSFEMCYSSINRGYWCLKCSGKNTHSIEDVIKYINEKHQGAICNSVEYINNSTKLNLVCENGHNFQARYNDIQQGSWCPQCSELKSEKYIRSIFENLTNKEFLKVRPNWLINDKTNYKLELDGYNEEYKIAFECQGEQHYKYCKNFYKTKEDFKYQIYKDKLKKDLCKFNGVKLLCVPAIRVNVDGKTYKAKDIENLIKDFLINECGINLNQNQKESQED